MVGARIIFWESLPSAIAQKLSGIISLHMQCFIWWRGGEGGSPEAKRDLGRCSLSDIHSGAF